MLNIKATLGTVTAFLVLFAGPAAWLWAQAPEKPVDLNQASLDQLTELPGIGPTTAQRIVEYREKNGPFRKIEDLMNVRGIGEKKFLRLKDRITVGKTAETPTTPEKQAAAPDKG